MTVEQAAQAHYVAQQTVARGTVEQAQTLWQEVEPGSVLESWLAVLGTLTGAVTAGQLAAASLAQPYLNAVSWQQGFRPTPEGAVNPAAFAGIASNGLPLTKLLIQPALRVLRLLAGGADDRMALLSGLAALVRIVDTEITDTARAADQVGITANRRWVRYVRVVNLPACGRCILLAGQSYPYSTGFLRHPQDDCTMVPLREGDSEPQSPKDLFERMTPEQQAKAFTVAGAEAIRLGADPGKVVHARRGMQTAAGRLVTSEGVRHRKGGLRPMPEQILADADGNRDRAIELLRRFGYLT
ncbi:VG15 protein [Nonomuraea sediminis]|uniref:VG15 protein n=1 Tax=Nonomuraea sediminis TaxID=2835864 RepID=UPI001BDCE796|nr:hypothetical protein [Nonomuraea sediminis]